MNPLLHTKGLTRRLEGEVPVTLVREVSIEINRGEFVIITGPSGSGKSSLLYLLGLLDLPTEGELWFNGNDMSGFDEQQRADTRLAHIGYVFQFHFLLPEFSALQNVMLPMQRLGALPAKAMRDRAQGLLENFGLGAHLHKRPHQLSGGQSQRVAIARALANDPPLLLADEPTGNLDTAASANVRDILRTLTTERNCSVITVTHDVEFAKDPDRLITIVDGRVG